MNRTHLIVLILVLACTPKEKTSTETQKIEEEANSHPKLEELLEEQKEETLEEQELPKLTLYLNGIYEYKYPYNTEGMNENQYIAFNKNGDTIDAWYFGTSDEFDEAREGYLPGYFISRIQNLSNVGDSIFFSVSTARNQCYSERPPIGIVDENVLKSSYKKWHHSETRETINYEGKLDGLKLYISMFGETRTYRKTRNYFHPGINNYDSSKCQSAPLLTLDKNLDSLTSEMILDFLSVFSVTCEANVEFGQWSNELLFKILDRNPELTLMVLSDHIDQLDTTSIYKELQSPLYDLIPVDSITSKIEALTINEQIKSSVLLRLEGLN